MTIYQATDAVDPYDVTILSYHTTQEGAQAAIDREIKKRMRDVKRWAKEYDDKQDRAAYIESEAYALTTGFAVYTIEVEEP